MSVASAIKRNFYQDSLSLLRLAQELKERAPVHEVAVLMGTPANKQILTEAGLLTADAGHATPTDLVIAVRAANADDAQRALAEAERLLTERRKSLASAVAAAPRTLETALRQLPSANVALISVPGEWAAAEARSALRHGLHVMVFSDNVPIDDEVRLKRSALAAGRLLMGPDCGTAIINGVALGFANAVPRGALGLIASSGTGLQQVMTLLAGMGEGVSHAIGVGGRDAGVEVGGSMTLAALDALAADASTGAVVVIGKPPAPNVQSRIAARAQTLGKPCVLALLGAAVDVGQTGSVTTVATLEDAAYAAAALRRSQHWAAKPFTAPDHEIQARVQQVRRRLTSGRTRIVGLYAGGTLAHEARLILGSVAHAEIIDLGADEYTRGRPHPMLDSTLRVAKIHEAARADDLAVLLVDVVLGHGAAPDPAGDLADALAVAARSAAVVACVVGTTEDPQGYAAEVEHLERAGAWVLPSNAQAARAAALIVAATPRLSVATVMAPPAGPVVAPAPSASPSAVTSLLGSDVTVVNVGLEAFAEDLAGRGVPVVHVDWRPPAGGDPRLARLLAELNDG